MAKTLGCIKLLMWIGIVLFLIWFLLCSLAPEGMLRTLGFAETQGYFLRLYGIFPLGWAVLFLFALKNVEKNIAILNSGVIVGILTALSLVIFQLFKPTTGWFHWLSAAIIFVFSVLIYICKPKAAKSV